MSDPTSDNLRPAGTEGSAGQLAELAPSRLPEPVVPQSEFGADGLRRVAAIAEATSITDTTAIMTFGAQPQERLSRHLDELLRDETIGQAGVGGEIALEVSRGIDRLQLRKMRLEIDGRDRVARLFGRLPVIGRHLGALRAFFLDRQKIVGEFARIERRAQDRKIRLLDGTARFDSLIRHLEGMLRDVAVHLVAGERVLAAAHGQFDGGRRALAAMPPSQRDPVRLTKLRDFAERAAQFEVRMVNLHVAFLDAVHTIPGVRNVSKAAEIEIQNVMESLLSDIPRLKRAVLQMVSLNDLRRAWDSTAQRKKLSSEIAVLAAQETQDAYLAAKRSRGDVEDDLPRLDAVAGTLLQTLREGTRIEQGNQGKRERARARLAQMRGRFAAQLVEAQSPP